jgi:hypothetical protein
LTGTGTIAHNGLGTRYLVMLNAVKHLGLHPYETSPFAEQLGKQARHPGRHGGFQTRPSTNIPALFSAHGGAGAAGASVTMTFE